MAASIPDPIKAEAEVEFYGMTLDSLKAEFEIAARLKINRVIDKLATDVIECTADKITVETAVKLKSMAKNVQKLVKPEIAALVAKQNADIDKYFSIPNNMPLSEVDLIPNSAEVNAHEAEIDEKLAKLEKIYKQQSIMMMHLLREKEYYDALDYTKFDADICDSIEESTKNQGNENENSIDDLQDLTIVSINDSDDDEQTLVPLT